jgi:hypothetical protein
MKSALVIDFRAYAFDFDRLRGTRLCRADVRRIASASPVRKALFERRVVSQNA